jgi:hypothetical protein
MHTYRSTVLIKRESQLKITVTSRSWIDASDACCEAS